MIPETGDAVAVYVFDDGRTTRLRVIAWDDDGKPLVESCGKLRRADDTPLFRGIEGTKAPKYVGGVTPVTQHIEAVFVRSNGEEAVYPTWRVLAWDHMGHPLIACTVDGTLMRVEDVRGTFLGLRVEPPVCKCARLLGVPNDL